MWLLCSGSDPRADRLQREEDPLARGVAYERVLKGIDGVWDGDGFSEADLRRKSFGGGEFRGLVV